MSQKSGTPKLSSERIVKDIRRATRKQYSVEEKTRIVLDGLRGEHSIAELCRREGIAEGPELRIAAAGHRLRPLGLVGIWTIRCPR
jgi:transposase-like protein